MHIITGLLISALAGRSKLRQGAASFPGFRGVAEVRHALPGRLRLMIPAVAEDPKHAEALQKLEQGSHVYSVTVDTRTASVLITYDPQKADAQVLTGACIHLLGLEEAVSTVPRGRAGAWTHEAFHAVDRSIYEHSGGILDLHTAAGAGLITFGVYKLLTGAGWGNPGAATLAWWASSLLSKERKCGA